MVNFIDNSSAVNAVLSASGNTDYSIIAEVPVTDVLPVVRPTEDGSVVYNVLPVSNQSNMPATLIVGGMAVLLAGIFLLKSKK